LRLVIHDHCGHLGQVHLSRQLARRGHQVEHQFCVSYTTGRGAIQLRDGDPESLLMIGESCITDRHYFDCSGHVILRPFSTFGGLKSIVQSHELDFADNKTEPGRIVLGGNAVTTAGCILLKDSYLPERSVLAAGSVLPRARRALTCRPPGFTAGPRRVSFERSRNMSGGIAPKPTRRQYRLTTKSFVWSSESGESYRDDIAPQLAGFPANR